MTAYVIVDIHITDPVGYEEYKKLASSTVDYYGWKCIARGRTTEILGCDWSPGRLVILEFENSAEYSRPRPLRHKTATSNMVVIGGV